MPTIDASKLLRAGLLQGVSIVLAGAETNVELHAAEETRAGRASGLPGAAVQEACTRLGASVFECRLSAHALREADEASVERAAREAVQRALAHAGRLQLLVVDGASVFAHAASAGGSARDAGPESTRAAPGDGSGDDSRAALRACLDASWSVTRAVAASAFLPAEGHAGARGGRIVYLAPPPGGGARTGEHASAAGHAGAARAGLENLARTLSIEWARYAITAVTIAPGEAGDGEAGDGEAGAGEAGAGEVAALTAYLASPAGAYFSGCVLDLSGAGGRD
jgi:NAD(P)-dependent dehydrogenase (short-subunit alcohol dehydrogenase family)